MAPPAAPLASLRRFLQDVARAAPRCSARSRSALLGTQVGSGGSSTSLHRKVYPLRDAAGADFRPGGTSDKTNRHRLRWKPDMWFRQIPLYGILGSRRGHPLLYRLIKSNLSESACFWGLLGYILARGMDVWRRGASIRDYGNGNVELPQRATSSLTR